MDSSNMTAYATMLLDMSSKGNMLPEFTLEGQQTNIEALEQQYAPLHAELSDRVLTEAHESAKEFAASLQDSFPQYRDSIAARQEPKSLRRVKAKLDFSTRKDRLFKSFCDLAAVQIVVPSITDLATFANQALPTHLTEMASMHSGCYVKRPTYKNDPDLVYFSYLYLPQYKHVIEIQVVHPFAARVFAADSAGHTGTPGPNFWASDFYDAVKKNLLDGTLTMEQIHEVTRPTWP